MDKYFSTHKLHANAKIGRGRRFSLMLAGLVCLGVGLNGVVGEEAAPKPVESVLTDAAVMDSISKGVDFLFAARNEKTKRWEKLFVQETDPYHGGETCLALFALLHVGENSADQRLRHTSEELKPAVQFVTGLVPRSVYVASLQLSALQLLPKRPEVTKAVERAAKLLAGSQLPNGGHTYQLQADPKFAGADNSNTQYAHLGMWAALDAGVAVPADYWKSAEKYWRNAAAADGGWGYREKNPATSAMTGAGLSSLLIITEQTDRGMRLTMRKDEHLDKAFTTLGQIFDPWKESPYGLYSVERAGLLSGYKFLGRTNWFTAGAKRIVDTQRQDGGWNQQIHDYTDPVITTSMCLLFLARGRNPVLFNKLEYDGNWHARPRDLAVLAGQVSKQFERPFNWQVVGFGMDSDEWLDAPALLITGTSDPAFTPRQIEQLRAYVGAGGMIFSVAVGNGKDSAEFNAAIPKYAEQITGRTMRELPNDHVLFSIFATIKDPPKTFGASNGIRELWVHSPLDLGANWHMKQTKVTTSFDLPANVYFYACGKEELRTKLASTSVKRSAERPVRSIPVGRLKYEGNWNPEFGAWERMGRVAAGHFRTQLDTQVVNVDELDQKAPRILWMTGTEKLALTDAQVAKLKAHVSSGGIIAADAAGGSKAFDESFRALVARLFPGDKLEMLDGQHSLFAGFLEDAGKVTTLKYRPMTEAVIGKTTTPRLFVVNQTMPAAAGERPAKRLAVVYSPHDLTCGFAAVRAWGVDGYTGESAEVLGRNMLLYMHALTRK